MYKEIKNLIEKGKDVLKSLSRIREWVGRVCLSESNGDGLERKRNNL